MKKVAKGHPMQALIDRAYKSAIALKGAEAAVIRAAVYCRTHPLSRGRYKRLDDAVDKLLRAREIRGR